MKLEEEKKKRGIRLEPVFIYRVILEWGGTGFICFLIHRITENQRNFGKASLETVGFGVGGLCKDLGATEEKKGKES